MMHRTTLPVLFFKWLITLPLLANVVLTPGGMVVLAVTRSQVAERQTQSMKRESGAKSGDVVPPSAAAAMPVNKLGRISLTALDPSRVPTEEELRMAGQLGSPLSPSAPADPANIKNPEQRKQQEEDNLLFGQAIQKWNQHDYGEAI